MSLLDAVASPALRGVGRALSPGGARARLSVLMYHRVLPERDPVLHDVLHASLFDTHMRTLREYFNVLPLGEAVDRLHDGTLPPRAACVTFDDGYRDNVEVALPILRRHGLQATFFIATGFLDGGRMFNDTVIEALRAMPGEVADLEDFGLGRVSISTPVARRQAIDKVLRAVKYLPPERRTAAVDRLASRCGRPLPRDLMMDSPQVRSLADAGMEIGAHTVNHPILTQVPIETAREEISGSKIHLQELLQRPIDVFAYPNGVPGKDYAAEHVPVVRDAGFKAAVSTSWGAADTTTDVYQLPRFTPWDRTPAKFAARMLLNCVRHTPTFV